MTRDQVFAEIGAERERQAAKWGRSNVLKEFVA
jgi:hypothetical protein